MGFFVFFKKSKIENHEFITILRSANLNVMIFTTNYCSKSTDNVSGDSINHIESPWTLNITSILLSANGDRIWDSKSKTVFIIILDVFTSGSIHEVVSLGLEFIGLWLICLKYINFLMRHTQYVWTSYPYIRWALVSRLSVNPSIYICNMIFRSFLTLNSI